MYSIMRSRNYLIIPFLAILIGLFVGDPVDARTSAERQAIMEREVECITRNFDGSGNISWQNSCSSSSQQPSRQYDAGDLNDTYSYNDDGYSDYSRKSEAARGYYQEERGGQKGEGSEYDYDELDAFEEDPYGSDELHYSYGKGSDEGRLIEADFRLVIGRRHDDFDWNIASDITGAETPNILSELTWSDLQMTQLKLESNIVFGDYFVFDGMLSYADIFKGKNQDSDYLGDDRTGEFSRSNNNSSDGEAKDWSVAGGLKFYLEDSGESFLLADKVWLSFLGGYSYHELNLIITEGFQTIPELGAFGPTLHSSYWSEWDGPWLGIEVEGSKDRLFGVFRFSYHWADYYGSANWNLRTNFAHPKSYEHIADGNGIVFNLGAGYHLSDSLTLNLQSDIQDWEAEAGIDRTFFSDGSSIDIRLNRVKWASRSLMFGGTYSF